MNFEEFLTLLHYIADFMAKTLPDVRSNLTSELTSVFDAKNYSISILSGDVSELRKNLANITEYSKYLRENPRANDHFLVKMTPFLEKAKSEFDLLEKTFILSQKVFNEIVLYFAEDPKTMECNEFFGQIQRFILNFEKAHKDLIRWKEIEQKALRQQQQQQQNTQEQPQQQKPNMQSDDSSPELPTGDKDEPKMGIIEKVLADLFSGRAYTPKATRSRQKKHKKRSPAGKKNVL